MAQEREGTRVPTALTGIHINLKEHAIEFEDQHGTVGRIVFSGETVLVEGQPLTLAPRPEVSQAGSEPTASPDAPDQARSPTEAQTEQREKQPTVVVSGKLMNQPRAG